MHVLGVRSGRQPTERDVGHIHYGRWRGGSGLVFRVGRGLGVIREEVVEYEEVLLRTCLMASSVDTYLWVAFLEEVSESVNARD